MSHRSRSQDHLPENQRSLIIEDEMWAQQEDQRRLVVDEDDGASGGDLELVIDPKAARMSSPSSTSSTGVRTSENTSKGDDDGRPQRSNATARLTSSSSPPPSSQTNRSKASPARDLNSTSPKPETRSTSGGELHPSTSASPIRGAADAVVSVFSTLLSPEAPRDPNMMSRPTETKAQIIDLSSSQGGSPLGGSARYSVNGSPTGSPHHSTSPRFRTGSAFAADAKETMKQLLISVNFIQSYVSPEAKVLCVLILLISLTGMGMVIALLVRSYLTDRTSRVLDTNSICFGSMFTMIHTSSFTYNITNIIINCLFMIWFGLRAVRLEKEGLMFCFLIVALIHIARSSYFAFSVLNRSTLSAILKVATQGVMCAGNGLLLLAFVLSVKVYRGFGWRMYSKGVTAIERVAQLRRFKQLDAVIKLDTFMTFNTFASIFFVVASAGLRVYGLVATIVTLIALFMAPWAIKHRHAWFVYLFAVIAFVLPAFYIYVVVTTVFFAPDDLCPHLTDDCLTLANITIWNDTTPTASGGGGTASPLPPPWYVVCPPGVTSTTERCWAAGNCVLNGSMSCVQAANTTFDGCCDHFGRCNLKVLFRSHDQVLMTVLAVAALLVRVAAVVLGFRQLRDMNLPSMKELLERTAVDAVGLGGGGGGGGDSPRYHRETSAERPPPTATATTHPRPRGERDHVAFPAPNNLSMSGMFPSSEMSDRY